MAVSGKLKSGLPTRGLRRPAEVQACISRYPYPESLDNDALGAPDRQNDPKYGLFQTVKSLQRFSTKTVENSVDKGPFQPANFRILRTFGSLHTFCSISQCTRILL